MGRRQVRFAVAFFVLVNAVEAGRRQQNRTPSQYGVAFRIRVSSEFLGNGADTFFKLYCMVILLGEEGIIGIEKDGKKGLEDTPSSKCGPSKHPLPQRKKATETATNKQRRQTTARAQVERFRLQRLHVPANPTIPNVIRKGCQEKYRHWFAGWMPA